jgi:uncharacterized protein (TIGR03083 family)
VGCPRHEMGWTEAMSETPPEISCENCVAACCKAPVYMQLSRAEHKRHSPPMELEVVVEPRRYPQRVEREFETSAPSGSRAVSPKRYLEIPSGFGIFELKSGCPNLTENDRCSIYADRPQCCRDLAVGSLECLRARRKAGLDQDGPPLDDEESSPLDSTERVIAEFFPTLIDREPNTRGGLRVDVHHSELAELRGVITRDTAWIAACLSRCDGGAWSRRTRCPAWNVLELAAHLVTAQRLAGAVLTGAIEGRGAKTPGDFRGDPSTTVGAFARAAERVEAALAQLPPDALEREVVIDDVEAVTVRHLVEVLALELTVHALDLAEALGETRHLTEEEMRVVVSALPDVLDPSPARPETTAFVLRSVAFELPFTWRNSAWWPEPGSDPCSIEGEPEAVLLFALGRASFNKSNLTTNRPKDARTFKRHLRGP